MNHRRLGTSGLCAAALTASLLCGGLPAQAEEAKAPATAAEAALAVEQLTTQERQLEDRVIALRDSASATGEKVEAKRTELAAQQQRIDALHAQLGQFALAQFQSRGTNTTLSLLGAADSSRFLDRVAVADQVTATSTAALQSLQQEQSYLDQLRKDVCATLAGIDADLAEASELEDQAEAKMTEAQAVQDRLSAEEKATFAAEQARKAAAAEAERAAAAEAVHATATAGAETAATPAAPAAVAPAVAAPVAVASAPRAVAAIAPASAPAPAPVASSGTAAAALSHAYAQVGKPYVLGATGPHAFDCSGLTMAAYRAAGVSIPRTASAQWRYGRAVPLTALVPGDLVIFYGGGHVGIYAGNGMVVHAGTPQTGVEVLAMRYMPASGAVRIAG